MRSTDAGNEQYLGQIVDIYDPASGLMLPERIAYAVSLAGANPRHPDADAGPDWRRLLAALLRDPGAPRLRTLLLHDWSGQASDPYDVAYEEGDPTPLLRKHAARLARLAHLFIGAVPTTLPPTHGVCQGPGLALPHLPALVHLHLHGERGWELLPSAGHPALRTMRMHIAEPDDNPIAILLAAPFPALTELDLWACPELLELAADGTLIAALTDNFTNLERLTLRNLDDPTALAGLLSAALPPGLHSLALTHAPGLDDAALAPLRAAIHLRRLDLRGTACSPEFAAELATRIPEVQIGQPEP